MADEEDNPLISALPPATDYLTYLTIIEFNLTKDDLPTLHKLLQDVRLTINIGWDLVHILLPMLPESRQCLDDVANLGNPREVILKVTELLPNLYEDNDQESSEGDEEARSNDARSNDEESASRKQSSIQIEKYNCLLEMLAVLHARIKTARPSRFLETSAASLLTAMKDVTPAYAAASKAFEFVTSISKTKAPPLPPRGKEAAEATSEPTGPAPDPEAPPDNPNPVVAGEEEEQKKILRALLTWITELAVSDIDTRNDGHGLLWTKRWMEKVDLNLPVPQKGTVTSSFSKDEALSKTDGLLKEIAGLFFQKLKVSQVQALEIASNEQDEDSETDMFATNFEHSQSGLLTLLALQALANSEPSKMLPLEISRLQHQNMIDAILGEPEMIAWNISNISNSVFDALVLFGWFAYGSEAGKASLEADKDEEFNGYLQRLAAIASNHPSPDIRYQTYLLTSAVLHTHPSSKVRLDFIKGTLENCPYENLKAVAIGWVRREFLSAFDIKEKASQDGPEQKIGKHTKPEDEMSNVFKKPQALLDLAPFLFAQPSEGESSAELALVLPFYLGSLNFLYLLCQNTTLKEGLEVVKMCKDRQLEEAYLSPLSKLAASLSAASKENEPVDLLGEGMLLENAVSRAKETLKVHP